MKAGRINIHMQKRQLTILVPVKKNRKLMMWIFLSAIPWVIFLWLIIDNLYRPESGFWWNIMTLLIIFFWSSAGLVGYTILSFMFFGREKILINPEQILIEKPVIFYNRRNYYLVHDVSNIRIGREIYKVHQDGEWKEKQRNILQMDYPDKQVIFCRGVSQEEAEWILLKIAQSNLIPIEKFNPIHQI